MNKVIRHQIKETFTRTFPNVKCTFDNQTVIPSFVYQDGPALEKVKTLLAPFDIQVIRVINAGLLGKAATTFLGKYVNADNTFARRGFVAGYITVDVHCSYSDKQAATNYAMSLDADVI